MFVHADLSQAELRYLAQVAEDEPLRLQIDDFLDAVRTGRRPMVDAEAGFAAVRKESPRHDMLLRNALVLEGFNRNTGIHAAGVLITPSPLIEHAPLYKSTKGDITVQFDMNNSEALGLLKMDFLGLRTLTVIDKALDLIAETTGKRMTAEEIPTDDPDTYQLLQEGRTVGVFQLESSGMKDLLIRMKPACLKKSSPGMHPRNAFSGYAWANRPLQRFSADTC